MLYQYSKTLEQTLLCSDRYFDAQQSSCSNLLSHITLKTQINSAESLVFWQVQKLSYLAGPSIVTLAMAAVHVWEENRHRENISSEFDKLGSGSCIGAGTCSCYRKVVNASKAEGSMPTWNVRCRFRRAARSRNEIKARLKIFSKRFTTAGKKSILVSCLRRIKPRCERYKKPSERHEKGKWIESWSPDNSAS